MKFKTVEWVRKVRDENYEKCKNMSPEEKIEYTKEMANRLTMKRSKIGSITDKTIKD